MTITALNLHQAAILVLLFALTLILYAWKVRPYLAARPEFHNAFKRADTFWAGAWAWLKIRWDLTVAGIVAAAPTVWNGGLDLIVAVSDIVPLLHGVDLSWLVVPGWVRGGAQLLAISLPVIRARIIKHREG